MGPVRGTYGPVRAPPSRVDPPPYGGREAKSDPTREGSACVGIVRPPPCGGGRTIPTQALRNKRPRGTREGGRRPVRGTS